MARFLLSNPLFSLFYKVIFLVLSMLHAITSANFSCILIFGDSTVDTGNNNYLLTLSIANHHPYGIDFINGAATGRFSNGRLVGDFLASGLGIKESVPPFLRHRPTLSRDDILTGVSFASAGSGYDEQTNSELGVISVFKQVDMFKEYLSMLTRTVGSEEKAKDIVSNALFLISSGTNDFGISYYELRTKRRELTVGAYQDFIINQKLQDVIKGIYDLGGRKFMVPGLGPIGCVPIRRHLLSRKCRDNHNSDAVVYNAKLQNMVKQIQVSLPGSKIAYVDSYGPAMHMINHPKEHGFKEVERGCCGTGLIEVGLLCNLFSSICPNRSEFMFFDSLHPSETVYRKIATVMLDYAVPTLS